METADEEKEAGEGKADEEEKQKKQDEADAAVTTPGTLPMQLTCGNVDTVKFMDQPDMLKKVLEQSEDAKTLGVTTIGSLDLKIFKNMVENALLMAYKSASLLEDKVYVHPEEKSSFFRVPLPVPQGIELPFLAGTVYFSKTKVTSSCFETNVRCSFQ